LDDQEKGEEKYGGVGVGADGEKIGLDDQSSRILGQISAYSGSLGLKTHGQ